MIVGVFKEKCKQVCPLLAKVQKIWTKVVYSPPTFGTMSVVKGGEYKAILPRPGKHTNKAITYELIYQNITKAHALTFSIT